VNDEPVFVPLSVCASRDGDGRAFRGDPSDANYDRVEPTGCRAVSIRDRDADVHAVIDADSIALPVAVAIGPRRSASEEALGGDDESLPGPSRCRCSAFNRSRKTRIGAGHRTAASEDKKAAASRAGLGSARRSPLARSSIAGSGEVTFALRDPSAASLRKRSACCGWLRAATVDSVADRGRPAGRQPRSCEGTVAAFAKQPTYAGRGFHVASTMRPQGKSLERTRLRPELDQRVTARAATRAACALGAGAAEDCLRAAWAAHGTGRRGRLRRRRNTRSASAFAISVVDCVAGRPFGLARDFDPLASRGSGLRFGLRFGLLSRSGPGAEPPPLRRFGDERVDVSPRCRSIATGAQRLTVCFLTSSFNSTPRTRW